MKPSDLLVYAVSACNAPVSDLEEAQAGGVTFLQLREKELGHREFLEKAKAIRKFARVPFVVNDDVQIALESGADGVHVGQGDAPLSEARQILGPDKIVGVSCTNLKEAVAAERGGADYLGVGAMFPTGTKLDAAEVAFSTLKAITASVHIPVVAIGGITADNVIQLGGTGAAGAAVVSALFGQGSVRNRTIHFAERAAAMAKIPVRHGKGAIIDLDGFLLDSLDVWSEVDRVFLGKHAVTDAAAFDGLKNCSSFEDAARFLTGFGLVLEPAAIRAEATAMLKDQYRNSLPLLPGALDFLKKMRSSGRRTVLLTASPEELALPALDRLHVRSFFDHIICGAEKKTPDAFYQAAELLGTGIRNTTVYDDSAFVLDVASAAGFPIVRDL